MAIVYFTVDRTLLLLDMDQYIVDRNILSWLLDTDLSSRQNFCGYLAWTYLSGRTWTRSVFSLSTLIFFVFIPSANQEIRKKNGLRNFVHQLRHYLLQTRYKLLLMDCCRTALESHLGGSEKSTGSSHPHSLGGEFESAVLPCCGKCVKQEKLQCDCAVLSSDWHPISIHPSISLPTHKTTFWLEPHGD